MLRLRAAGPVGRELVVTWHLWVCEFIIGCALLGYVCAHTHTCILTNARTDTHTHTILLTHKHTAYSATCCDPAPLIGKYRLAEEHCAARVQLLVAEYLGILDKQVNISR